MSDCLLFIPTLTAGGAERVASILANEWQTSCCRQVAVVTLFREEAFFRLAPEIDHVCIGIMANRRGWRRLGDLARAFLALRRAAVARKPKFVLSFMNKYNAFCVLALFGTGLRVVVAERDSPTEVLPRIRVAMRRLTYPLAAGVLVQSNLAREFILATTRARHVQVLYNPVVRLCEPAERRPEKVVLCVSRLHAKKGQMDLLAAFARCAAGDWRLVFCGEGPMREVLQQQAQQLGISARTEFLGTVADLRPHLLRAGIFAFPSYWEGFPNALAEAMLAGIPCVSYDCPTGPSELIQSGANGLLVPLGDIKTLSTELRRLMGDSELRVELGRSAAEIAGKVEVRAVSRSYWDTCMPSASSTGG